METLIVLALIVGGIVFGLRYLRQREIDAFMDADMTDFQSYNLNAKREEQKSDPIVAKAEAYAALNPEAVKLNTATSSESKQDQSELESGGLLIVDEAPPEASLFLLKDSSFDEVSRRLLKLLGPIVPDNVLMLTNVPLSEIVRVENDDAVNYRLKGEKLPYLFCDSSSLSVLCALRLKESGVAAQQSSQFLKNVFNDIGCPLIELPLSNDISEEEIRDQLDPIFLSREQHQCPKCGEAMTVRKAMKGKHAGNVFWVCSQFPACRGVIRA